jgi:hypothetical protein
MLARLSVYEWRLLRADRTLWILTAFFAAVVAYGVYNGVAWKRENGTVFCRLAGHQMIDGGFYLFPVQPREAPANGAGQ